MSDRTQYVTKTFSCADCEIPTDRYVPLMGRVEVALLCDGCLAARVAAVRALRAAADRCIRGHLLGGDNILIHRRRGRPDEQACRACAADHRRAYARRRQSPAA